jgi:poly(A) polymerase
MTKEKLVLKLIGRVVKGTEFEGKTFLAGGAVRDEIMGNPVKDIDIVVSMPDGGIKFAEWITQKTKTYKKETNPVIFPRFGTAKFNFLGVKIGDIDLSGIDIEVVMTRGEKYEKGSRKPEVVYADLEDDAYRRDLTVNSLFKDVVTGEIKDLTGKGIQDIKDGIVRTPLDPDQTFKDDPLRMLRAVRFSVKYEWKMAPELDSALKKNADLLQQISKERIKDELNKILMTKHPDEGLKVLSETGLMQHIIPELDKCRGVKQNKHHKHDVFEHILEVVKNTAPDLTARLASLFHDIGKPDTKSEDETGVHFYRHEDVGAKMTEEIMARLKYSNEEISSVRNIVANHMDLKQSGKKGEKASDKQLRKFMVRLGKDLVPALKMMHADNVSHKADSAMPDQIAGIADRIKNLKTDAGEGKPKLPINGNDIMQTLGIKPGPQIKDLLAAVEDAWYKNPKITKDQALAIVKKTFQQSSTKSSLGDILNKKIKNPKTNNDILVKTALKYPNDHPARQLAIKLIKQQKK